MHKNSRSHLDKFSVVPIFLDIANSLWCQEIHCQEIKQLLQLNLSSQILKSLISAKTVPKTVVPIEQHNRITNVSYQHLLQKL